MKEDSVGERKEFTAYDTFLFGLAIISLINLALWILLPSEAEIRSVLSLFDSLIALVFLFDFFRNLSLAPDRLAYMKWGWLDFLGGIPITGMAIFRLARVIRIFRVIRQVGGKEFIRSVRKNLARHIFSTALLLMMIVVVFGGVLVYRIERSSPESSIQSPSDAIWWAFVTITTVGYGDEVPASATGKVTAVIVMLVGVGLASVLTGLIARFFITAGDDKEAEEATKADIESLRAEIAELKRLIQKE